jgi:HEAT repeats
MKHLQRLLVVLLFEAVCVSYSTAQEKQINQQFEAANRRQIEVSLVPDKPRIMLGEPVYLSFIVQNELDEDLQVVVGGDYQNSLGRPDTFSIMVTKDDGKRVPQPDAGMSFGGLIGPQNLPARGNYVFRLFLPHWATFEEIGDYIIVAKRTLKLRKYSPSRWYFHEATTDVPVEARATIEVLPTDRARMGEVIEDLGTTMLTARWDKNEAAANALSNIQDERVIPYFGAALETNDYNLKFKALWALAKFNNDAAFQSIKDGLETKGEDIGNTINEKLANQSAENIRNAAAIALSKSPHPGAIPFLLSKRNDPSEGIRITVLHVLGKMKPQEAIPILQEMVRDTNERVRKEAERYLHLLSSRN